MEPTSDYDAGMEPIENLIAEIARIHKVALTPDDPVAMLVTVNRFLLRELAAAQMRIVQEFRETVATSASDWHKLANKRAETILNATIQAAKLAVASGAETGLSAGLSPFLEQAEAIARHTEHQLRQTRRLLWGVTILGSVLALGAAALNVLLVLRR